MLIIFPVLDRIKLLPFFLKYYASMGATQFVCALYNGERNPLYDQILSFASQYNLHLRTSVNCNFDRYSPQREMLGLNKIRMEFAGKSDWYGIADLDEFHFCGGRTIPETIGEAEARKSNAVHGVFFDRIAAGGGFSEIGAASLDDTFPLSCNLTFCSGAACNKIAFARSHVRIERGHHHAKTTVWRNAVEVHHFKWQKGIFEMYEDRYRRFKRLGLPQANRELPAMLKLINRNGINIDNKKLAIKPASKIGI